MSAREQILARVREALRTRAARPACDGPPAPGGAQPAFRPFLAPVPATFEERKALFAQNAESLRAEFFCVASAEAVAARLNEIGRAAGWKHVAVQQVESTGSAVRRGGEFPGAGQRSPPAAGGRRQDGLIAGATNGLDFVLTWVDDDLPIRALAACDASITTCEALVAQTGSVVITSRSSGGRAMSVLPPHHVVVARREQLVGDLSDAYAGLAERFGRDYPSFLSIISGPSRTGDIEHVIVLGAHGPRRLTIFLVE